MYFKKCSIGDVADPRSHIFQKRKKLNLEKNKVVKLNRDGSRCVLFSYRVIREGFSD